MLRLCICGDRVEGRSRFCVDCRVARSSFATTEANVKSNFNRKSKTVDIGITRDEFCLWRKKQKKNCYYCDIDEAHLPLVGMKSQIQLPVKVLGVDRLDSSVGYVIENMAMCCFVCNQIKGDRFTSEEMLLIGKSVREVWESRLLAIGG